jgi:hypothetical protein
MVRVRNIVTIDGFRVYQQSKPLIRGFIPPYVWRVNEKKLTLNL